MEETERRRGGKGRETHAALRTQARQMRCTRTWIRALSPRGLRVDADEPLHRFPRPQSLAGKAEEVEGAPTSQEILAHLTGRRSGDRAIGPQGFPGARVHVPGICAPM